MKLIKIDENRYINENIISGFGFRNEDFAVVMLLTSDSVPLTVFKSDEKAKSQAVLESLIARTTNQTSDGVIDISDLLKIDWSDAE